MPLKNNNKRWPNHRIQPTRQWRAAEPHRWVAGQRHAQDGKDGTGSHAIEVANVRPLVSPSRGPLGLWCSCAPGQAGYPSRRTSGCPSHHYAAAHTRKEEVMRESWYKTGWACLAVGVVVAGLLLAPGIARGQSLKEEIVGAWRLVSQYNEENGVKRYTFGEKPVGLFIFDRSGYVMQFLSKPELPRFADPNRLKGTDKEYREVMQGVLSGFGTYTIDGDTVTIKWVASSFPNRAGTTEKRVYKIVGDELTGMNPTGASGSPSYTKFVRAK